MKKTGFLISLVSFATSALAGTMGAPIAMPTSFKSPIFMYSYLDFDFDSTTGANFNRYQGHSNIYLLGGDYLQLTKKWGAGLYISRTDTATHSQFKIDPNSINYGNQGIQNYTTTGHIRKSIDEHFDFDFSGSYGWNAVHTNSSQDNFTTFAKYHSNNWFVNANLFYHNSWQKLLLTAGLGFLYSRADSPVYTQYSSLFTNGQAVGAVRNTVTDIIESIELGYKLTPMFTPFIGANLIQVAGYSNNAPTVAVINGTLPQLNLDQNAYRVGGGVMIHYKRLNLRIEEKYYNAANIFSSYQTIATASYLFL